MLASSSVEHPVSALRQRMLEDMAMRGLRSETPRNYIRDVRSFAAFLGRSPDTATAEDIRRFQVHQAESGVQGTQRPQRHAFPPTARPVAAVVEGRQASRRHAAPWLAVPRTRCRRSGLTPADQPRGPGPAGAQQTRYDRTLCTCRDQTIRSVTCPLEHLASLMQGKDPGG